MEVFKMGNIFLGALLKNTGLLLRFFKFINPLKFYFSKKKKQRKTKSDIKKIFKELEYNWFIIQDIQKITKYPDALTDSGIKAMQSINQTLKLNKYELIINSSF